MSRLTKEQHEQYMHDIMGRYENPDEAAPMIEALRNDYAESVVDAGVPQSKYDELKRQYIDRFFGGNEEIENVKHKQDKDTDNDEKSDMSYETLFKNAESYTGKDK